MCAGGGVRFTADVSSNDDASPWWNDAPSPVPPAPGTGPVPSPSPVAPPPPAGALPPPSGPPVSFGPTGFASSPAFPGSPTGLPEYATFGRRLAARIVDGAFALLVFVPILAAVAYGAGVAVGVDDPVVVVVLALLVEFGLWELAYYVVGASHGQTVGKRAMGIKVCRDVGGDRIGLATAIGRQFASVLSTLALGIGWLAPLWTPKRQTWQDSMTGTVVVRDTQARLAGASVVWGLVWTVLTGLVFGAGIGALIKDVDMSGGTSYDGYDSGAYDSGSSYDDGIDGGIDGSDSTDGYGSDQIESFEGDGSEFEEPCPTPESGTWSGTWTSDKAGSLGGTVMARVDISGEEVAGTMGLSATSGSVLIDSGAIVGSLYCDEMTISVADDLLELEGTVSSDGRDYSGTYRASADGATSFDTGTFRISVTN